MDYICEMCKKIENSTNFITIPYDSRTVFFITLNIL